MGSIHRVSETESVVFLNGCSCKMLNRSGRRLPLFQDGSFDAIITDAPHYLPDSLTGGNRNFAQYPCFEYSVEDFEEKYRLLKDGCFLVEIVPEENATNFEYLYYFKKNAIEAGFQYYSKVPWKKGDFVANTGRKSKNVEDVLFFTKGDCRSLRPNAKKNKADPSMEYFMSGASGMLPTLFDVQAVSRKDAVAQSQKPLVLIQRILEYVTKPGELVLDQFAGSGVVGIASLCSGRNACTVEVMKDTYERSLGYATRIVSKE